MYNPQAYANYLVLTRIFQGFDLVKNRMVDLGYPKEIMLFDYDPTFPIRGLWFDSHFGNLLKVDAYGNILSAVHGFEFLKQ